MKNEIKYKGKTIEVKFPSGMFEYYSDKEGKFLKFDTLKAAKKSINKEPKRVNESTKPKTQKIKLSEVRQLVRKMLKEERDDIIEFTIPDWALSPLINGDYSGLSDDDEEKLKDFVNDTVNKYGNAHFMDGDKDLGFCPRNDIDNLGSDCHKLLLRPDRMNESTKPKTQKIKLSEVRQLVRKMLKEANQMNVFYVVFDGTSHIVLDKYDYTKFIKKEPKEFHKILFKTNDEDKAFDKAEELNQNV